MAQDGDETRTLRRGLRPVCDAHHLRLRRSGAGEGHMLEHLLGHHRPLPSASRPHPRLGEHSQGKRIPGAASYGDGARRQLGGGADPLAPHGRNSRERIRSPLEIQERRERRGKRAQRMAPHHQGHTRRSQPQRHRLPRHAEDEPLRLGDRRIHPQRETHHHAGRLVGARRGFRAPL